MKKLILLFILAFILISCKSSQYVLISDNKETETIILDIKNISPINNGIFEGWGTSLCWWGNRIGGNEKLSNDAAKLFFSEDEGIGLNIVRYNIGGGDDPNHKHITRSDSAMPGFLVYDEKLNSYEYDWTKDYRQRNVLKKIVKENKDVIVEFFSNSPPYFMTQSGCTSGAIKGSKDNLKKEYFEAFADYLANVTYNLSRQDGINVQSVEPLNESSANWEAFSWKQEGSHFSIKNKEKIIELTRNALDAKGLSNVIVSGTDETGSGVTYNIFFLFSKKIKNTIGRINTHTYWYPKYKALRNIAIKYNKKLWVSETDSPHLLGKDNGEMGPALSLGRKIITDMNGLKPSAWIIWQVISGYDCLEEFNGVVDGYNHENFSGSCWGVASGDFINEKLILSKKYYGFGQFSKYIRPNSYVIYTENENYIASLNKENNYISIVCLNPENYSKTCSFDLTSFLLKCNNIKTIRTSGMDINEGENLAEVDGCIIKSENNTFSAELIPNSITTFILEDLTLR